ncbi:MAG: hypothetical protein A2096_15520 [Spirochaetes bacterium GWF1_41_5]|nr:MAG: hypothetical protein A2096_15520 [Spirochaetes bacterium GWF1_41_5]HBE04846.1 hypothetical protein [Spirochaetia bacterium]
MRTISIIFFMIAFILPGLKIYADVEFPSADRDKEFIDDTKKELQHFTERYYYPGTKCLYGQAINGPKGIEVLEKPADIQKGLVKGEFVPYGYGSGISDTALAGGMLLFALCDACDVTEDPFFTTWARNIFGGFKLMSGVSKIKGFVPRGPHPDGKSYYTDISRDQISATIYALWRFYRCQAADNEDKKFIKKRISEVMERLEKNNWSNLCEDGITESRMAGEPWDKDGSHAATTLPPSLAMVYDVTGEQKWLDYYSKFAPRQLPYLDPDQKFEFQGHPLYIHQQMYKLVAFLRIIEKVDNKKNMDLLKRGLQAWGKALPEQSWPTEGMKKNWKPEDLGKLGWNDFACNSYEGWKRFNANLLDNAYAREKGITGKTYGLFQSTCIECPMGNFLGAFMSYDRENINRAKPLLDDMLKKIDFNKINNLFVAMKPILYRLHLISLYAEQKK